MLIGKTAAFGGDAALYVSGKSYHNSMVLSNNRFIINKARAGGGGINMSYTCHHSHQYPMHNLLDIHNSSIFCAKYWFISLVEVCRSFLLQ